MNPSFYPEDGYVLQEALAILKERGYQVSGAVKSLDELYDAKIEPPSLLYLGRRLQRDQVPAFDVTYRGRLFFRYSPQKGFDNLIPNNDPEYGEATEYTQQLVLENQTPGMTNPIVRRDQCTNPYVDDGRGVLGYREDGRTYCFSHLEKGQLLSSGTNPYTGVPFDSSFLSQLDQAPACETQIQLSHLTRNWLVNWVGRTRRDIRIPVEVQRDLRSYRPCQPIWLCNSFKYTEYGSLVDRFRPLHPGQEFIVELKTPTTWSTDYQSCARVYRSERLGTFVLDLIAIPGEILVELDQVEGLNQRGVILLPGKYRVYVRQESGETEEMDPDEVIALEADAEYRAGIRH